MALTIGAPATVAAQNNAISKTVESKKVVPAEFNGDLRLLPALPIGSPAPAEYMPLLPGPARRTKTGGLTPQAPASPPGARPPMPAAIQNFPGMSFADACAGGQCGTGWPPDTNGDVGPNHYIQGVNGSFAIYSKTGTLLASFRENQLWSGAGSTTCNGNSRGDPVVVYDPLADRWILTNLGFASSGGVPVSPFVQCIAVSKTSDPVAGGWWLYSLQIDTGLPGQPPVGALNDYPKFGTWHDCLYMGSNMFQFPAGSYAGGQFATLSRADLYNGNPLTWAQGFLPYPANDIFSMFPANSVGRGPTAVQPGTPAWFVQESLVAYEFDVRSLTPGPNCGGGGTLSAATNIPQDIYTGTAFGTSVPQPNTTNLLDNLADRLMNKIQYRKVGGVESLWIVHTVPLGTNQSAIQWAQLDVTGGTIAAATLQQQIYSPDAVLYRTMPSIVADNQGNVAVGFSTSGAAVPNFPSIQYAGRLVGDAPNTLPQTEVPLILGLGSQTNTCGGGPCHRWGDYSGMSLDPVDQCTFWYTNEYYDSQVSGTAGNWHTRIGSFKYPGCTPPSSTAQRTFVASNGNDGNPCSLISPCRSFGAAILKTTSGGEVVALDTAGYGPVVITQPVSIIAPPGIYAGVTVQSGTGIVVNPVVGKVTLRGLTINGLGGTTGIDFQTGDALYLDNVVVSGFPTVGLNALVAATGTVQVNNSIFRSNGIGASFGTVGGTTAALNAVVNNSNFDGNATGVRFQGSSAAGEIRGTTLSGGSVGVFVGPTVVGAVTRVDIIESTITKNTSIGVSAGGAVGGATANVGMSSSLVSGNSVGVSANSGGNVFLTDSTVTRNVTGLQTPGGAIASGTLNRLYNNGTNGVFGSTVPRQ